MKTLMLVILSAGIAGIFSGLYFITHDRYVMGGSLFAAGCALESISLSKLIDWWTVP